MKLSLVVLMALVVFAVACNKDKFQTKPTISVKSISDEFIPLNGNLIITLDCTDKEGDVQDSVILIKRRLNSRAVSFTLRDTIRYKIPPFPDNPRTQIQVTLSYQNDLIHAAIPPVIPGSSPPQKEPDSLYFRIAVKDKGGNTSDTIDSPRVIIFRQ